MAPILREFGPGIWTLKVRSCHSLGFPIRPAWRQSSCRAADCSSGRPIALSPPLKRRDRRAGTGPLPRLAQLLHNLFLGEWKSAYPDARLFAPPGLRRRRKDLAFDADSGDAPDPLWAADIDQVLAARQFRDDGGVFFHRASGAAIFADLIQNFPAAGSRAGARLSLASPASSHPIRARREIGAPASPIAARRALRWSAYSPGRSSVC